MSAPRVRACIVAWRSGERAVRACASAADSGAEVVLFDNSPGDGTAGLVARALPSVRVLSAGRNLGFGAASNRAAAGATTDYLLFLNPDAVLAPGALAALVAHLDAHPEAGLAGPSLRFADGRPQPSIRRDPGARAVLHQYSAFRWLGVFRPAYREYRSPADPAAPEVLMGSVLLVRRGLFESLGGFDPRYFMYYEDADLCRRARERGARLAFVPAAEALHAGGASEEVAGADLAAVRLVSAQRYLRRFMPRGRYVLFRLGFLAALPPRAMFDLCRDLSYAALCGLLSRPEKARRKWREARSAARLLSVDLWKVVAA